MKILDLGHVSAVARELIDDPISVEKNNFHSAFDFKSLI